ncbi:MAG: hypothetical protein J6J66_08405 [Clostridia bacterium]|nr:hypothetical protein [Clostridia bacterium]
MKRFLFCTLTVVLMLFALAGCFGSNHVYDGPCDTICNECNVKMRESEADHTYDSCADVDCNVCGETREAVAHTYVSACATKCSVCGEARTETSAHVFDSPCDSECNVCKETREASDHVYTNDCDTDCEFCGALRVTEHIYTNGCDKDCNVCGALRIPNAHVYTYPCDLTCDVCGAENPAPADCVYSFPCDADCNLCGTLRNAEPHIYDHACDPDCNVCGIERAVNDHVYDNSCDAECNACGTVRENVHAFGDWKSTSPANCEDAEILTRYCADCGETETKEGAAAIGHDFTNACDTQCNRAKCGYKREITHTYVTDYAVKVGVSCTTAEILHRFCDVCGAEDVKNGAAALGHEYDHDCDTTCNRADCDYVRVIVHAFGEWETLTPENCVDAEVLHRVCSVEGCGLEETKTGKDAHGHSKHAENCTICSICGEASGFDHEFGAWETLTPADCYEAEVEIRVCGICEMEETQEGDPAHGHHYASDCAADCIHGCGFTRVPPHNYDGIEDLECNDCGYNRECTGHQPYANDCTVCRICGEASGIAHEFGAWETLTPADCYNAEVEIRYCANCIVNETRDGDTALGHTPKADDCTVCGRCGDPTGNEHSFGAWATKTPADCENAEVEARSCTECHKEETRDGDIALGHTYDNDCDTECNVCHAVRAVAHDFTGVEWAEKTPSDCNNAQVLARKCILCQAEETKEGEKALGHAFENACDTECDRCHETRTIEHSFGDWVTKTPADCDNAEVLHKVCSVCFAGSEETMEGEKALGHTYTDECDTTCNRCSDEREAPHKYTDEHDVICDLCGHVRPCNGHKALATDCLTCEYCGEAIPGAKHEYTYLCDTECDICGTVREASHSPSAADCTVCQYCSETIPGAAHVATATDCTVCKNCNAGTGVAHVADPENCTHCKNCEQASGKQHTPNYEENCTECADCGKALGTAHTDADKDGHCDKCPAETLPGENWFPWAPL